MALRACVAERRLERQTQCSEDGATREQVVEAWREIERERSAALLWARSRHLLQGIVQEYDFERRRGSFSVTAHEAACRIVAKTDATVADPLAYAGYIIEWAEREHRTWFWRCCRDHHVL